MARLRAHGSPHPHEHVPYPDAGHLISSVREEDVSRRGGTVEGNRAAQVDARERFFSFFERHLGAGRGTEARPLWHGLEPGPHPVGWRVVTAVDETRPFACRPDGDGPGRPMRLFVWYPAAHSDAPVLRHGDYFEVDVDPVPYSTALRQRDLGTLHSQFSPSDSALTRRILETPVPVVRSPEPGEGSHPVVVHVLGRNDYQQEATVLWEYLASHGYVVVVPPQMGACAESGVLAFDGPSIEVQVRDVAFALGIAEGWSWADASRAAVVGHSSGAVVALRVAEAGPRARAIVSLDGSIATDEGGDLMRSMGMGGVETALLDLQAAGHPGRDTAVLDSLSRGPVHRWAFGAGEPPRAATHFDFQNWPLFATLAGVEDERGTPFRPSVYGRDIWLAATRLTGAFLDHELSGKESALADWRREPPAWLSGVARPIFR